MKKIKSPWYGVLWIVIWTAALVWFLASGWFDTRESIALVLVWLILVGVTIYTLILYVRRVQEVTKRAVPQAAPTPATPSRNEPCPCGSGKKYKRCCGALP